VSVNKQEQIQNEPVIRSARTICLINQKGGCGKSSTCFHLGGSLAKLGYRVLLVDADPQGSLSQAFFGSAAIEELATAETLAAIFDEETLVESQGLVVSTPIENISIVRANQSLARFNQPQPEKVGLRQYAVAELLKTLADGYDFVLIDCPPNLYLCSWSGLLAADTVLIPVPPEDFGTQGLRAVHAAINNARLLNPKLNLLGHVVTRVDRRLSVHRHYEQALRSIYADQVLETTIPEASAFKVSLACRQPVSHYSPKSKAGLQTARLAEEIQVRMTASVANRKVA
jgi:chromosome partitioning protein